MSDDITNIEHVKAAVLHGDASDACMAAGLPAAILIPAPPHMKVAVGLLACASGVATNIAYNFGKDDTGLVAKDIENITFEGDVVPSDTGTISAPKTPETPSRNDIEPIMNR